MARFILETAGEDITVGGDDVTVVGTAEGGEVVTVVSGNVEFDASFNQGGDTIVLPGEAEDYTATISGNRVILTSATGATVSVPVGSAATTVNFGGDDARDLRAENGDVMLGEQTVDADGTTLDPGTDEATTLTQALENLQEAQGALATFLAETELENDPTPLTPTTEADITAVRDQAVNALNTDVAADGSDAQLAADLSDAEDDVETAEAQVALTTGLSAAINDLEDAQEEYQADIAAAQETYFELAGEVAAFATRNGVNASLTIADAEALSNLTQGDYIVEMPDNDADGFNEYLIEVGANGQLIAGPDADPTAPGFAAMLADAQAAYDAALEMDASETAFSNAIDDVVALENVATPVGGPYFVESTGEFTGNFELDAPDTDALFDARNALEAAQDEIEERNELRQDLADAQDLVDQVEELNENIGDAEDAIEDLGYEVPVTVSAGSNVDGTVDSDIFVLDTGATGTGSAAIDEFGAAGDDILFVGSGYTMAELGATADLANSSQGDVNELEVFIRQEGDDTVLYFEDEAFAGNATTGTFQGFTVTLEDVDADTVSLDATGYITIEETATVA